MEVDRPRHRNWTTAFTNLFRAGATVGMVGPERMKQLAEEIAKAVHKAPGKSPDSEPNWELWTTGVTMKLAEFSEEANKIIAESPAL
jgi:hypothetical protein